MDELHHAVYTAIKHNLKPNPSNNDGIIYQLSYVILKTQLLLPPNKTSSDASFNCYKKKFFYALWPYLW